MLAHPESLRDNDGEGDAEPPVALGVDTGDAPGPRDCDAPEDDEKDGDPEPDRE